MPVAQVWVLAFLLFGHVAMAQDRPEFRLQLDPAVARQGEIKIVFFGGPDCPICRAWLAQERPQWQLSVQAKSVELILIDKAVRTKLAGVSSWPASIGPLLKNQLIKASSGRSGSPFLALVVQNQVVDFYWGAPSAAFLVSLIEGVRGQAPYPVQPCVQLGQRYGDECALYGQAEAVN
jgi:hypothetical protein